MFRFAPQLGFVALLFLTACEGEFAGKRELNLEMVNGPFQMKIRSIAGTDYLVLLNTNYRYQAKTGSLHFYSLSSPTAPVKAAGIASLELPSNSSDFEIVQVGGDDVLFAFDRNDNKLLVYDFSGSAWTARLQDSTPLKVSLASNPQSILAFNRSSDGRTILAVTLQSSGTLVFIDATTLDYIRPDLTDRNADVFLYRGSIPGARFRMTPRKTFDNPKKPEEKLVDRITTPSSRQIGLGISQTIFLGGTYDLLVSPNMLANALHSFRFSTYQNMANLSWDLRRWKDGEKFDDGTVIKGSKEWGFRGIDSDNNRNIYLSSRTDNRIYKIPASELEAAELDDEGTLRNTIGYQENIPQYALETYPDSQSYLTFDTDLTDKEFTRLGFLLADKTGAGLDSAALWVVGLNGNKIYRVGIPASPSAGDPISITHTTTVGEAPQRLLGYPVIGPYQYIYVANSKSDTISILNAADLALVGQITN